MAKYGNRPVLLLGLLLQTAALFTFAILVIVNGSVFPFGYMFPAMMAAGIGMGLSFTPLSHGILAEVPEHAAGEASGISNATRELGGVFGIAISGTVFEHGSMIRSASDFGHHLIPTLYACAAMLILSFLSIVMMYKKASLKSSDPIKQKLIDPIY